MKLKGERELLAEDMYYNIEIDLYNIIKEETQNIAELQDIINDETHEKFEESLEKINNSNTLMYNSRKVTEALLNAEFTLEEIKILLKYSEEGNLVKNIAEIINENRQNVNVNNIESLSKFIKLMLLLKVKYKEE